jgi:hypothetical protein
MSPYPTPVHRSLRGYALDPSLAQELSTVPISSITLQVPWEELTPGPAGEYLEIVDYDPAQKCFYEPIDLRDPSLLAQNGLAPSEGSPQFHQQMVYAVARLTIRNFEMALGRKALWGPGPSPNPNQPFDDSHYVARLRIYPHALQEANAYYSPAKKALLFGYYPASEDDPGKHVPGSMVFTALSHDIIAHETAHALLDGIHRRLNRATNPDMLALHEAFADVVALFQHFTFSDVLRHQIAVTRGDLQSQENVLGQLASQFGRTTGARGALRDAIGTFNRETGRWEKHKPDPSEYDTTFEPHRRGAILVAAIFDAFLSIYNNRVSDLFRLYTQGSGVLAPGAIHPDLVNRLADEAAKAASHVLTMCVRALDYCPPVDVTFGEYLRAIITADVDVVPDDRRNYRVAFVEAFRRRGLYPRDVRTLAVDSLRWRRPDADELRHSDDLRNVFGRLRDLAYQQGYSASRREVFDHERQARIALHDWLEDHFAASAVGRDDATFLGLDVSGGQRFEVHKVHLVTRSRPNAPLLLQAIVHLAQRREMPVEENDPEGSRMRFDGGSTVVIDLDPLSGPSRVEDGSPGVEDRAHSPAISYCIRKPITSTTRLQRQRAYMHVSADRSLRSTYFGERFGSAREPFALIHRGV